MSNEDRLAVSARVLSDPGLLSGNPELAYMLVNLASLLDTFITHGNGEDFAHKVRIAANAIRRVNVGDRQGVEEIVAEPRAPAVHNPKIDTEDEAATLKGLADPKQTVVLREHHRSLCQSLETARCTLEVHVDTLPNLVECFRVVPKAASFSAPELVTCNRIINYAAAIDLPKLRTCDMFADVKAETVTLPALEEVVMFSTHNAKRISLPKLRKYRSFWVYHGNPRVDIGSALSVTFSLQQAVLNQANVQS